MASKYRSRKVNGVSIDEHRLVWMQAHGPIPKGYVVHHRNGLPRDNRLENLELLTYGDHSRHHNDKHPREKVCVVCGRDFTPAPTKRERAKTCSRDCFIALAKTFRNNFKLTPEQHAEIRRRIAGGEMQKTLAAEYGVSPSTVTAIKKAIL